MTCAQCSAADATFFSNEGDPLCKMCFNVGQIAQQQQRADDAAAEHGSPTKLDEALAKASPVTQMFVGILATIAALGGGVLESLFLGEIHLFLWGGIAVAGLGVAGKAWMSR
jgi:hypothetical protein